MQFFAHKAQDPKSETHPLPPTLKKANLYKVERRGTLAPAPSAASALSAQGLWDLDIGKCGENRSKSRPESPIALAHWTSGSCDLKVSRAELQKHVPK